MLDSSRTIFVGVLQISYKILRLEFDLVTTMISYLASRLCTGRKEQAILQSLRTNTDLKLFRLEIYIGAL